MAHHHPHEKPTHRMKKLLRALEPLSHNPLFVALVTLGLGGYGLFIFQTAAENQKQMRQARFDALRDIENLHATMITNLDLLAKARCDLISQRLTPAEINQRSSELQDRLSRTREQAEAMIFRIEAVFSPSLSLPWYRRAIRKWSRDSYVAPREIESDDVLGLYQDLYSFYSRNEAVALAKAWQIPMGIRCESDDNSWRRPESCGNCRSLWLES
jgi:hypothetical protein